MLRKIAIVLTVLYIIMFSFELDDKLYSYANRIYQKNYGVKQRIDLDLYQVSIDAKAIKEIEDNLSGLTYNKQTQTLFGITNSPRRIYELTLDGDVLRVIELFGFKDTEGITYIKENTFAVIDERKQGFYLLSIAPTTKSIYKKNLTRYFQLKIDSYKNFGFEGIAYDETNDVIFIVNERFPSEVIKIHHWMNKKEPMRIVFGDKLEGIKYFMNDFSGLHFDDKTGHILFLSDESKLAAEVSMNGERVSFMDLEKGFLGLKNDIPQAEGITMDENRNVYIVSEPNLFYKFTPSKKQ